MGVGGVHLLLPPFWFRTCCLAPHIPPSACSTPCTPVSASLGPLQGFHGFPLPVWKNAVNRNFAKQQVRTCKTFEGMHAPCCGGQRAPTAARVSRLVVRQEHDGRSTVTARFVLCVAHRVLCVKHGLFVPDQSRVGGDVIPAGQDG